VRYGRRRQSGDLTFRHGEPDPAPKKKRSRSKTVEDNLARLKREAAQRREVT
jgi:hypothetical protein